MKMILEKKAVSVSGIPFEGKLQILLLGLLQLHIMTVPFVALIVICHLRIYEFFHCI